MNDGKAARVVRAFRDAVITLAEGCAADVAGDDKQERARIEIELMAQAAVLGLIAVHCCVAQQADRAIVLARIATAVETALDKTKVPEKALLN